MAKTLKQKIRSIVDYLPNRLREKRRHTKLSRQREHYSAEQIRAALDAMPVPDGAIVLVHSSLKAIGFVDGGPQAVVSAFVDSIVQKRGGTLVFPTYSINGTMHNTLVSVDADREVIFDVANTRSNLGAIPEFFRQLPGVVRSVHPTHSFSALGPLAQELTGSHHTCNSSFGRGSPMAVMLNYDSYLLGLGTTLGNVTMYHCLEEIEEDFPFNVYTADSPLSAACRDLNGEVHKLSFYVHDSAVAQTRIDRPENQAIRDFFTRCLEGNAGLSWHKVCEADTWLVSAPSFYAESARLMRDGITIYSTEDQLLQQESF